MKNALPLILLGSLLLVLAATASANAYVQVSEAGFQGCDFTFTCSFSNIDDWYHDAWPTCDDELVSIGFNNAWSTNNNLTYSSVVNPFQGYDHVEGDRSLDITLKDVKGTGSIQASCDFYLQDEWTNIIIPCATSQYKTRTQETPQVQIPSACAPATASDPVNPPTGSNAPIASFNYSPSSAIAPSTTVYFTDTSTDPFGSIASRSWNFGNGQTSADKDANATYASAGNYVVTLTVTDSDGLTSTKTRTIIVATAPTTTPTPAGNQAPNASFNYSPATPAPNSGVFFVDTSTDSDGIIVSRTWNLGNGAVSSLPNPSAVYTAAGTYNVTLSVTDNNGATRTATQAVTVTGSTLPTPTGSNQLPIADFNYSPVTSGKVNKNAAITFTDLSIDLDGNIVLAQWTFGDDGSTSTGATAAHSFKKMGAHAVLLTVRDNNNGISTASKTVTVERLSGSNNRPTAKAGGDKDIECGETVTLNATGSSDSDGVIVLYEWELEGADDFSSTTTGNYSVEYDEEGTFTAKLRVTDDEGATDTDTITIEVERDEDEECDEDDDWTSSDDLNPVVIISGTGSTGTFTPQATNKPLGYSCVSGSECASTVCSDGRCAQCQSTSDCLNGNYCSSGSCYAKKLNGSECSSDSHCKTNYCNAGTCSAPFTGDLKDAGETCAKDSECGTSHCAKVFGQSSCVECVSSTDCAGGQKCSNYSCEEIDCLNGTIVNRECVPFECVSDADCPSEESCNESTHSCEDRPVSATASAGSSDGSALTGFASLAFNDEGRVNFGAGFMGLLVLAALTGFAAYSYMMRSW